MTQNKCFQFFSLYNSDHVFSCSFYLDFAPPRLLLLLFSPALSPSFSFSLYTFYRIEQKTLCIVSLTRSSFSQSENVCAIKTNISCFKILFVLFFSFSFKFFSLSRSFARLFSPTFFTRLRFSFVLFCYVQDTQIKSKVQIDLMHLNYDMKHELSLLLP